MSVLSLLLVSSSYLAPYTDDILVPFAQLIGGCVGIRCAGKGQAWLPIRGCLRCKLSSTAWRSCVGNTIRTSMSRQIVTYLKAVSYVVPVLSKSHLDCFPVSFFHEVNECLHIPVFSGCGGEKAISYDLL